MRKDVEAAVKRMGLKFGAKREIKKIDAVLQAEEEVQEIARGDYGKRTGLLILTDQRLIFFNDGWTGSSHEDFSLSAVGSVGYSGGMLTGKLKIHASGNAVDIENVRKEDAKRLAEAARKAIVAAKGGGGNGAQASTQDAPVDPIEQIRRLGELKEVGVLTEAEFESKKSALLEQI